MCCSMYCLFLYESRLQDPKSYTGIHKRNNVNALCALHEAPSSSVKPPPTHQHTSAKVRLRLCIRHVSVSLCARGFGVYSGGSVGQSEHATCSEWVIPVAMTTDTARASICRDAGSLMPPCQSSAASRVTSALRSVSLALLLTPKPPFSLGGRHKVKTRVEE
jgi:hypothetical protein